MTAPFLAMITPLAAPSSPGVPTHPIYIPPGPVDPSYGVPIPGVPTHPIAGPPVYPSHPIYMPPPVPTHPIVIVPPPPGTGDGAPPIAVQLPVFPWTPQHPIVLPPEVTPEPPPGSPVIEWKIVWTPATGWVVVGLPTGPTPTPSK
jgi:hypothetical protein